MLTAADYFTLFKEWILGRVFKTVILWKASLEAFMPVLYDNQNTWMRDQLRQVYKK